MDDLLVLLCFSCQEALLNLVVLRCVASHDVYNRCCCVFCSMSAENHLLFRSEDFETGA